MAVTLTIDQLAAMLRLTDGTEVLPDITRSILQMRIDAATELGSQLCANLRPIP